MKVSKVNDHSIKNSKNAGKGIYYKYALIKIVTWGCGTVHLLHKTVSNESKSGQYQLASRIYHRKFEYDFEIKILSM